jgi:hypothetical protein
VRSPASSTILIACAAVVALVLPGCAESCGSCACQPADCADVRTTAADDGKTFTLAVGEWVTEQLPDLSVSAAAASSDSTVIKVVGMTKMATIGSAIIYASFQAVKAGSARLVFSYLTCPASTNACSYEVTVRIVEYPKTKASVSINTSPMATIRLHVGESARFSECCGPAGLGARKVTIDRSDVLQWAVEPLYNNNLTVEGAVTAVAPGTAHVVGAYCSTGCQDAWTLTVIVT